MFVYKCRYINNCFISIDPHRGILSDILSGIQSDIFPDILSCILSDFLSGILSDIYSGILSGVLFWFFSDILSGILFGTYADILSGILLWNSFWHSFWHSIWRLCWHIFWHSILIFFLTFYLEPMLTFCLAFFGVPRSIWSWRHSTVQKEDRSDGSEWRKEEGRKEGGFAPLLKSRDPHLAGGVFEGPHGSTSLAQISQKITMHIILLCANTHLQMDVVCHGHVDILGMFWEYRMDTGWYLHTYI